MISVSHLHRITCDCMAATATALAQTRAAPTNVFTSRIAPALHPLPMAALGLDAMLTTYVAEVPGMSVTFRPLSPL